jgi:hypothetical protein
MPVLLQLGAVIGRAAVLPDDGVVHRLAGGAVPHHRGLALVGDADAGDAAGIEPGLGQRATAYFNRGPPDLLGVVLDPAGLGKDLRQFLLCRRGWPARGIEDNGARAGGALVDGQYVFGSHGAIRAR